MNCNFDNHTMEAIRNELLNNHNETYTQRLKAILHKNEGYSNEEIAALLCVSTESIRRWINIFLKEGYKGLQDKKRSGRPRVLTKEQERKITKLLADGQAEFGHLASRWSIKKVQDLVSRKCQIEISQTAAHRLLSWIQDSKSEKKSIGEQRKIRRQFEESFRLIESNGSNTAHPDSKREKRQKVNYWYVNRFYIGKFLEGTGIVKTNYNYEIFCAVSISDIDPVEESLIECKVVTSSSLHPLKYSIYHEFLDRIIQKHHVTNSNSKLYIIFQDLDWEKRYAEGIYDPSVTFLYTPEVSNEYRIRHFQVMKLIQRMLKKSLKSNSLKPTDISRQIKDRLYEIWIRSLESYSKTTRLLGK
ncbi:helix-turn-helix domain-containing protein [Ammoniphilus sp. CFH 90114]|uniref:helix-turn-helix domain-containing protein n=1 Tax=Ammoniphilus sp. CFH 90114 TaxID=2493665 RepID=UPI00100DE02A|nr:helix-turn-helix domain-containing protein [Ammoniphilus sp. CFH 90114]RXT08851.1 helix-turn-helix domain-containing protein [Ammoniphilus sp. CFH 90114]